MKLKKHGKAIEPLNFVCPNCECEFSAGIKDCEAVFGRYSKIPSYLIACPECIAKVTIKINDEVSYKRD